MPTKERNITDMREGRPDYQGDPFLVRVKCPDGSELTGARPTITAARELRDRFLQQRREGTWQTPEVRELSKGTYQEYAESWRTSQVHRQGTADGIASDFPLHVYPVIGAQRMTAIRRGDIQRLVRTMSDRLAPATVERIYSYVSTSFKDAVYDHIIRESPCQRITLPKPAKDGRVKPVDSRIIRIIARQMRPEWHRAVLVGASSGLRPGELFGLTEDRVDFRAKLIRVERQVLTPRKGDPYLGPPKTEASYRSVPVPDPVLQLIREQLDLFALWAEAPIGEPPRTGKDNRKREKVHLLFPYEGQLARRQRLADAWHVATKGLVMPDRQGWHDLRHYYASMLIEGGESVKVIQTRLGHKSAVETLDTYGHLWPDNADTTRALVENSLRDLTDPEG